MTHLTGPFLTSKRLFEQSLYMSTREMPHDIYLSSSSIGLTEEGFFKKKTPIRVYIYRKPCDPLSEVPFDPRGRGGAILIFLKRCTRQSLMPNIITIAHTILKINIFEVFLSVFEGVV